MQFQANLVAQPFDTLLYDFTSIADITPLADSTFIVIGERRGSVRVSRINFQTETIWTQDLTDSLFYGIGEFEIHTNDNDSSIQILTVKTSCGITPPGIAILFTLDFNGFIKDTVGIPFES